MSLPDKRTTVEIRVGSSPAVATLVVLGPSEKVKLPLKINAHSDFTS